MYTVEIRKAHTSCIPLHPPHRLGEAVTDLVLLGGFYVLIGRRLELLLGLFDLLLVDGDLQLLLLLAPLLVQPLLINQLAHMSIISRQSINTSITHVC